MAEHLDVLLIEDSEDDAMLIVRELRHGGYDVDFERLDTSEGIKDALGRREWDIILCDHAMPQVCAPSALSIVKECGATAPFIIVSGWMTDELAKAAIKEGARDFIPKNKLARLVPVIQRELKGGKKPKKSAKTSKKSSKK